MKYKKFAMGLLLLADYQMTQVEQAGSAGTVFKWLGLDHRIIVETFDDPGVQDVTCYISRTKIGEAGGGLGLVEGTSDATISCQQVGPIELTDKVKNDKSQGDVVLQKRTSLVFKKLQVVCFYDAERSALVYLTYSNKVVDGSPKNAVSAVPIAPWNK